MPEKVTKNMSY